MPPSPGFIDPPSSFDPPDDWRSYLADLEKMKELYPEIQSFIDEAEVHLSTFEATVLSNG